jgi:hypothetical protein
MMQFFQPTNKPLKSLNFFKKYQNILFRILSNIISNVSNFLNISNFSFSLRNIFQMMTLYFTIFHFEPFI